MRGSVASAELTATKQVAVTISSLEVGVEVMSAQTECGCVLDVTPLRVVERAKMEFVESPADFLMNQFDHVYEEMLEDNYFRVGANVHNRGMFTIKDDLKGCRCEDSERRLCGVNGLSFFEFQHEPICQKCWVLKGQKHTYVACGHKEGEDIWTDL